MTEQKTSDGISDPGNYRKLSEPVSLEDAEKRLSAFWTELYDLRNKHGIQDAYTVVMLTVATEDGDDETVFTSMHCGNELNREPMTAWALGQEQANRQERIIKLMSSKTAIKKPVRNK
jgi:hypothetical protein